MWLMLYTYLSFAMFLLTFSVSERSILEFVRATVFLVFIVWLLVIILYDYKYIIRLYRRHLNIKELDVRTIIVCDLLVHMVPVFVLGLPRRFASNVFMLAIVCAVIWYSVYRKYIPDMYYLPEWDLWARDIVVYGSFAGCWVINVLTGGAGLRIG